MIGGMTRRLAILLLFAAAAAAPLAAQKTLSASNAWVKAPATGATTTTAFVVVDNPTMYDVYVMSAQTDVAGTVKFQRAAKTPDGKPESVEQVTAPAYDSVELTPDGVHLLLSDLKKALKPGDTVRLSLTTDSGIVLEVAAVVKN
jgi:copper(I)-binding protein